MENNNFCSIKNLTNIIKTKKEQGLKNKKIIQQLKQQGCCFNAIFDAFDQITKKQGVPNESIR
ncbi:hypothetical protein KO361_03680 [Candidatus Woesearchaeota archaeon]|nr:hypothetical protein [Candidatus Woesearchaeota archaeon]